MMYNVCNFVEIQDAESNASGEEECVQEAKNAKNSIIGMICVGMFFLLKSPDQTHFG